MAGIWGSLKGLFKPKEARAQEKVSINDIEEWFSDKSMQITEKSDLIIEDTGRNVKEKIEALRERVGFLENAELHNPNIPLKEKQYMEGNRKAYANAVNNLSEWIKFPKKSDGFAEFYSKFKQELEWFSKRTMKQYQILQHFFANEARDVAAKLKEIEEMIIECERSLRREGSDKIDDVEKKIIELKEKIELKKELKKELGVKEGEFKKKKEALHDSKDDAQDLEQGEEYQRLVKMKEDLAATNIKMKEMEKDFGHMFSPLEMAMRKYSKIAIENEEVLVSYLDNPVQAAVNDLGFKILRVLDKMKRAIEGGEIELKHKKKEKTLEAIGRIDKDYLGKFLSDYNKLLTENMLIEKRMKKNKITDVIEDAKRKVEDGEDGVKKVEGEMIALKEKIAGISLIEMKEDIEKNVSKVVGVDLEVGL